MGDEILSLVETGGNAGALILVFWLIRHTFTKTIPRLAEDFRASLDQQRKDFLDELRRQDTESVQERHECLEKIMELSKEVFQLGEAVRSLQHTGGKPWTGSTSSKR